MAFFDKIVFLISNGIKEVKEYLLRSHSFFLSSKIIPPDWPEGSAKSWQH
jgi:hypothetical protein